MTSRYFFEKFRFYIQIYPVSEGYLQKISVEKRDTFPEPPYMKYIWKNDSGDEQLCILTVHVHEHK